VEIQITLEQLRRGKNLDFASCFLMEYNIVTAYLRHNKDFFEGVQAVLVDKRKPHWSVPSSLDELTKVYFEPVVNPPAVSPLPVRFVNTETFFEYPHKSLSGIPNVEELVDGLPSGNGYIIVLLYLLY
jgi:hypothetical protein